MFCLFIVLHFSLYRLSAVGSLLKAHSLQTINYDERLLFLWVSFSHALYSCTSTARPLMSCFRAPASRQTDRIGKEEEKAGGGGRGGLVKGGGRSGKLERERESTGRRERGLGIQTAEKEGDVKRRERARPLRCVQYVLPHTVLCARRGGEQQRNGHNNKVGIILYAHCQGQ